MSARAMNSQHQYAAVCSVADTNQDPALDVQRLILRPRSAANLIIERFEVSPGSLVRREQDDSVGFWAGIRRRRRRRRRRRGCLFAIGFIGGGSSGGNAEGGALAVPAALDAVGERARVLRLVWTRGAEVDLRERRGGCRGESRLAVVLDFDDEAACERVSEQAQAGGRVSGTVSGNRWTSSGDRWWIADGRAM